MNDLDRLGNMGFGDDRFVFGEANEEFYGLDGQRVGVVGEQTTGTIYKVLINRQAGLVQLWVNIDSDQPHSRCFRPKNLYLLDEYLLDDG